MPDVDTQTAVPVTVSPSIGDAPHPSSPEAVAPEVIAALSRGEREARTLAESLSVDFALLAQHMVPELPKRGLVQISAIHSLGITQRMRSTARVLLAELGESILPKLMTSPSDTVRGWAAYLIAEMPDLTLADKLTRLQPLAADPHYGVREWAWLSIRKQVAADIDASISILAPWTHDEREGVRRFAVEVTRPRGVWSVQIPKLKNHPHIGLPIIEPLRADRSAYVQLSVSNWLSDAAKRTPEWVQQLTHRWTAESPVEATRKIVKRARRNI